VNSTLVRDVDRAPDEIPHVGAPFNPSPGLSCLKFGGALRCRAIVLLGSSVV